MRKLLIVAGLFCATATAMADVAQLEPVRDNTLIQNPAGALSNGSGPHLFAGANSQGTVSRAVLAFDVAAALPTGSIVTEVTLTLNMDQTNATEQTVSLHRVSAAWGEGASSTGGGSGAPSAAGDASWIHTFFADGFWANPGGDFVASSASLAVDAPDSYTWGSTPAMVHDVQAWLDQPMTNHGWLLKGNEASSQTAKRFDSRENNSMDVRPRLTVVFEPPQNDDDESGDDESDDDESDDDESDDRPGGAASEANRDARGGSRNGDRSAVEFFHHD